MAKTIRDKKELQKHLFGTLTEKIDPFVTDPIFQKRADEAREFLKKAGLPKELTKKK